MKHFLSAIVAALALLTAAPAPALEDYICRGQDVFTGMALNASTIDTTRFFCNRRDVRVLPPTTPDLTMPPLIHVAFKEAGFALKTGDTVTLKGRLYSVNDAHKQMGGWLIKDAEIVSDVPAVEDAPTPGAEAALTRYIQSLEKGAPDYDEMQPRLAKAVYARTPWILPFIQKAGAFKSLRFLFLDQNGMNVFRADFEHGSAEWLIAPLSDSGKVRMQGFVPLPASLQCLAGVTSMAELRGPGILPWQCQQWGE